MITIDYKIYTTDHCNHIPYQLPVNSMPYKVQNDSVDDLVRTGDLKHLNIYDQNDLFADRRKTSYLALDNIVTQIRRRYEIYDSNIRVLEYSKIKLTEHFYQWPQQFGFWPPGQREMLSEQMNQLYQKQLDEKVSLWKDVSKLKLMLPQSLNDYLAIKRKSDIYNGGEGF